jgi:hypothetical protein
MRRPVLTGAFSLAFFASLPPVHARAAEVRDALIVLEAVTPFGPGQSWNAAPLRFALLEDGQVFVGGSKELLAGRLDKSEIKALEAQLEAVRKLPGLSTVVSFGGDEPSFHLRATRKPLDVRITGDPAAAPPAFRLLRALLERLLRFDHPSLSLYFPPSFFVTAREASRPGGCRLWTLVPTPAEAARGTSLSASALEAWVGGVYPTAACVGDTRYEVQLRPLVQGEARP